MSLCIKDKYDIGFLIGIELSLSNSNCNKIINQMYLQHDFILILFRQYPVRVVLPNACTTRPCFLSDHFLWTRHVAPWHRWRSRTVHFEFGWPRQPRALLQAAGQLNSSTHTYRFPMIGNAHPAHWCSAQPLNKLKYIWIKNVLNNLQIMTFICYEN